MACLGSPTKKSRPPSTSSSSHGTDPSPGPDDPPAMRTASSAWMGSVSWNSSISRRSYSRPSSSRAAGTLRTIWRASTRRSWNSSRPSARRPAAPSSVNRCRAGRTSDSAASATAATIPARAASASFSSARTSATGHDQFPLVPRLQVNLGEPTSNWRTDPSSVAARSSSRNPASDPMWRTSSSPPGTVHRSDIPAARSRWSSTAEPSTTGAGRPTTSWSTSRSQLPSNGSTSY